MSAPGDRTTDDDTAPAWASALVDAVNDLRAETREAIDTLRIEAALIRDRLEQFELAVDRSTAMMENMQARFGRTPERGE